jgi:hypothetical protein
LDGAGRGGGFAHGEDGGRRRRRTRMGGEIMSENKGEAGRLALAGNLTTSSRNDALTFVLKGKGRG